MKRVFAGCFVIVCSCISSHAFAYGEGWADDIPIVGRQMQLLFNEARTDLKVAIDSCPSSICLEKACYTGSNPPYYWNDAMFKASQLHSNMLKYRDGEFKKYSGIGHNTPCTLVSNIASIFPGCDGKSACACKEKKFISGDGTEFGTRVKYFASADTKNKYSSFGETIAQSSTPENVTAMYKEPKLHMKSSPAYFYFLQLLNEGDRATGKKGVCKNENGNGHRFAILSGQNNTVGCGWKCVNVSGVPVCAQTCDYATIASPDKNTLTAGSHYKDYDNLWFKTHYYATVGAEKVMMRLGDQCVELKKTLGTSKNAVFGTSDFSSVDECTLYFFESMDENGSVSRFPSTGSLLFIPVEYSEKTYCNGKTWKNQAGASCICGDTHHLYNSACEENTPENCGSHGAECANQITGWTDGVCTDGRCVVSQCQEGYHIYENACELDSVEQCGSHDESCKTAIPGWKNGTCSSGKCMVSECDEDYKRIDNSCIKNSASSCGPDAVNCAETVPGWADGSCEQDACIASVCAEGYHLYRGQCEPDSVSNCGDHDLSCAALVDGWQEGECVDKQCIVEKCSNGAAPEENRCPEIEAPSGDETFGDGDVSVFLQADDCSSQPRSDSRSLPLWMLFGAVGAALLRRRRAS